MADSNVLSKELYPFVKKLLSDKKIEKSFLKNIGEYFNSKSEQMYDIAPYDRILYNKSDLDKLFASLGITEDDVRNITQHCYFYDIPINPQCIKEPYVDLLIVIISYYTREKRPKEAKTVAIYLAFSGKFYASLHAGKAFPTVPPSKYKSVMDYAVNNMMSDKFVLKKEKNIFGAIGSICDTWLETYKKDFLNPNISDDRYKALIQQLRERERAFLMNIAKLYYEAWQNRNYLNYETDNLSEEKFRLTDNDSATAARLTEATMNKLTSTYVDLALCRQCADQNVKPLEIKDILESVLGDPNNLPNIRRVVSIIICDFMMENPKKKVGSVEFVAYSIKAKPNTKASWLLEMKQIITTWLDENSPAYRKRKSRIATANSYYSAILKYLVLVINKVAR